MKTTILVIEDEPDMAMGLRDNLEFEGYEVLTAGTGEEGLELAAKNDPKCVLLDLMLPGIDGFETCRRLRNDGFRAPILMLTARSQEIDKVRGLELGADDYVTKPFGINELVARIRASLRRFLDSPEPQGEEMKLGPATVSFKTNRVALEGDDKPLGYYETEILRLLSQEMGEVVSRQFLLKEIWGVENEPLNRSVDNHVVSLRRKIESNPSKPRHLLTVHGMGYKLVP
ncbi:MAG: response regulator transcription factor [Planctomycetota bacterium]